MIRIKEILKEKRMTVTDLADRLGVSRQALSKQLRGRLLVESAERIAKALDVPMWQLFTATAEVTPIAPQNELYALIEYRGKIYKATTISRLEDIVRRFKEA